MTSPPADRIAQLLAIEDPPWLAESVAAWVADPGGPALHIALGLDRAAHCRALRDHFICQAWRVTSPDASAWRRALDLSNAVRLFASRVWPRAARLAQPDPEWSAQRQAIWHAFRAAGEVGMPQSVDRVRQIVESAGLYHRQKAVPDSGQ